jgi:hypothetical protein
MRVHDPGKQALAANQQTNVSEQPASFRCQNSNFVSYLIAANLLRYLSAEMVPGTRTVVFLLHDPQCRGPELLRQFNAGVAESVNARTLYEVRGFLLGEAKKTLTAAGVRDEKAR